jgi:glycosyltransferase involved in cell wall biosynthesis
LSNNPYPRILFVVNVDWFFLSHRLPIARAARNRGAEVWVAGSPTGQEDLIAQEGFHFVPIPFRRSSKDIFGEIRTLRAISRILADVKPDLVHNITIKPVLYTSLVARYFGKPAIVNTISGLGFVFISSGVKAQILRGALWLPYKVALSGKRIRVFFENPDDVELFVGKGWVQRPRTALIRGSGIDVELFKNTSEPPGVPMVMLASRMLRDKGVVEFADAARLLRKWKVNCRVVLVGGPDPGNPATVTTEELSSWVNEGILEWWGQRAEMEKVLPLAAIVVLPSYREGLPRVLQEAASVGRPIVATDVPGCREVVHEGENGYLVPPQDYVRLAKAIRRLVEDPELRARMGANSREMAIKEFRIEKVIESTFSVYDELLGGKFPGLFAPVPV